MSGNFHHTPEEIAQVRDMLLQQNLNGSQIAAACKVSTNTVYYQRGILEGAGLLPPRNTVKRRVDSKDGTYVVGHYIAPQPCLCSGCLLPATVGKFCVAHSARAMAERATAGMPEATRRKLMGAR